MSTLVSAWAWEQSRARGTALLVLLAIADWAEDDGSNAWPSVRTLARRTRMSERSIQDAINKLGPATRCDRCLGTATRPPHAAGYHLHELEVEKQAGGLPGWRDDRRPNRYRVVMARRGAKSAPGTGDGVQHTTSRGAKSRAHGVQKTTSRGAVGCTQDVRETSEETSDSLRPSPAREKVTPSSPRSTAATDLLVNALIEACNLDPEDLSDTDWRDLRRQVAKLPAGATPEQLIERAGEARRSWKDGKVTPVSLVKHYANLKPAATIASPEALTTESPSMRVRVVG